jgi:hypothetical protein
MPTFICHHQLKVPARWAWVIEIGFINSNCYCLETFSVRFVTILRPVPMVQSGGLSSFSGGKGILTHTGESVKIHLQLI